MKLNEIAFEYVAGTVPAGYICADCGAAGVKLWRDYSVVLERIKLWCAPCACARMEVVDDVDSDGYRPNVSSTRSVCIEELVPAIPTEENDTFWGYSSVPEEGVKWWRRLPTRLSRKEQNPEATTMDVTTKEQAIKVSTQKESEQLAQCIAVVEKALGSYGGEGTRVTVTILAPTTPRVRDLIAAKYRAAGWSVKLDYAPEGSNGSCCLVLS